MRFLLALLLLITPWPLPGAIAANKPAPLPVPAADRPLVNQCEAFFGTECETLGPGPQLRREERREAAQQRLAERTLARMPHSELERRLNADRLRLPRTTLAYASVVYTLGYFGIDSAKNVRRLDAVTLLNGTSFSVGYTVGYRLNAIYRRYPSRHVLSAFMMAHEDGVFQEDLNGLQGQAFLTRPRTVLQIAAHDWAAQNNIMDMLAEECTADDSPTMRRPILATLRRFTHNKNARIATVASECLRAIVQASK